MKHLIILGSLLVLCSTHLVCGAEATPKVLLPSNALIHAADLPTAVAKPNIIIILADDSGYSDLGCYGGEIDTPNLDKLAREGVRFRSFYNNSRCSPTRATLMTGRDSGMVGFAAGTLSGWNREMEEPSYRARLPYQIPTLPELLKPAGYRTLMVGKWHLGGSLLKTGHDYPAEWKRSHPGWELTQAQIDDDFDALPKQRGFDEFFGLIGGEAHQFLVLAADAPDASKGTTLTDNEYLEGNEPAKLEATRSYAMRCYSARPGGYPFNPSDGKTGPAWYATDGITDRALDMIQRAHADAQPFFLYLSYQSPHAPLQAPQELVEKYKSRYQDLGRVETARVEGLTREKILAAGITYVKTFSGARKTPPKQLEKLQEILPIHAAMMENLDSNVGRVVARLQELGQLDNTLIIYLSDNGAASEVGDLMNKPYRGSKALLWEGGPKTAFIARWPGQIQAGSISDTVGWVGDLLPTCLAVAGVTYPSEFRGVKTSPPEGRNLLPALRGSALAPPEFIFTNDKGQQGVIHQGRWKLLINPGWYQITSQKPGVSYELYDLATDLAETKDLSKEQPERLKQLAEACTTWQAKNGIVDYGELLKTRPDFSK